MANVVGSNLLKWYVVCATFNHRRPDFISGPRSQGCRGTMRSRGPGCKYVGHTRWQMLSRSTTYERLRLDSLSSEAAIRLRRSGDDNRCWCEIGPTKTWQCCQTAGFFKVPHLVARKQSQHSIMTVIVESPEKSLGIARNSFDIFSKMGMVFLPGWYEVESPSSPPPTRTVKKRYKISL